MSRELSLSDLAKMTPEQVKAALTAAGVKTSTAMSEEQKDKIRQSMLNKHMKHTPEAIEKMRVAQLGRSMSPESKAKLRQSMLARGEQVKSQAAEIEALRQQLAKVTDMARRERVTVEYDPAESEVDAAMDDTARALIVPPAPRF
jgi:hypothetical protein